jgi:hypothetical protein
MQSVDSLIPAYSSRLKNDLTIAIAIRPIRLDLNHPPTDVGGISRVEQALPLLAGIEASPGLPSAVFLCRGRSSSVGTPGVGVGIPTRAFPNGPPPTNGTLIAGV